MRGVAQIVFLWMSVVLIGSCKKEGGLIQNTEPTTSIFLEKIERFGSNRLNTIVSVKWSGEDKDGYILGYEISIDSGLTWFFTEKQDSTFNFAISEGSDTTDIDFFVRSLDNDGNKDQTPSYLRIPIKNTPPTIHLNRDLIKGDTAYSVFSLLWETADLDGFETIDSIYIRVNAGGWQALSRNVSFVTLVPVNPENTGITNAKIYQGYEAALSSKQLSGLKLEDINHVFIKVKDLSGAESKTDTLPSFFLRKKQSDLLVIDAHNINVTPNPTAVYTNLINEVYGNYDYYDMYKGGNARPAFWDPTFYLYMNLYKQIFIYTDATVTNNELFLESTSLILQKYLNNNGRVFITGFFPNDLAQTSTIFQVSPMDSFPTVTSGQRADLVIDSLVVPEVTGYPTLKVSKFMNATDPFYPKSSATVLYRAQLKKLNGWNGSDVVCAKVQNSQGKTNMVFSSVELYNLFGDADGNGQQDELKKLFEKVLLDEFDW